METENEVFIDLRSFLESDDDLWVITYFEANRDYELGIDSELGEI